MPADGATSPAVIVVGAGPAGSVTALLLARRGVEVLLLDRSAFPRPKACGDCMSAAATGLLARIGLLDRVRAAGASEIRHWEIISAAGTRATGRFHETTALSLERRRLDAVLLDAAMEAGARFRQEHVIDVLVEEGRVAGVRVRDGGVGSPGASTLGAALVVGADGLRSVIARRLDLVRRPPRLRKVSLTAHIPAPEPLRHGEMHLTPDGCVGYAPAGAGLRNVTVVVGTDAASSLAAMGSAGFLREHVRAAPELGRHLHERLAALGDDDILASGPFDVPCRTPTLPGLAMVGDAAGYYDPFTGQGIYQAMAGAEALDAAVGPALAAPRPGSHRSPDELDRAVRRYSRSRSGITAPARRVQRGVEAVLSRSWLADRVLTRLAGAPAAMDRLIEVTSDLRPPIALLSPAVVSSFMIPRPGGSP